MSIRQHSNKKRFKVDVCFLLIGQSNSVGVNDNIGNESPLTQSGIDRAFMWDDKWVPARDPMPHIIESNLGTSFARTFCRLWEADNQGKTIGIIPAGRSGSSLGGGSWLTGGSNYKAAISRAVLAKRFSDRFGGFLWSQGESDSSSEYASNYASNLETMIINMRSELNTTAPFVSVKIPDFSLATYTPYASVVNSQIESVTSEKFAYVSSDGLNHNGDGAHFDVPSQITLGQRIYTAWKNI